MTRDDRVGVSHNDGVEATRPYSTLREWAYYQIREMIITGALAPGADIHEGQLGAALGISKSPLREALRQLAQEGLVIAAANRGSFVAPLTEGDIGELYQLREYLEVMAVRRACAHHTPEQLAALRASVVALEEQSRRGNIRSIAQEDVAFHLMLARIADHRRLIRIQESLQTEMLRLVMQQFTDWGEQAETDAVQKHQAIVDAIADGDDAAAEAHMLAHLRRGEQFRRAAIARNGLRQDGDGVIAATDESTDPVVTG